MPKVNRKISNSSSSDARTLWADLGHHFWPVESSSEAAGVAETLRIRVMVPRARVRSPHGSKALTVARFLLL